PQDSARRFGDLEPGDRDRHLLRSWRGRAGISPALPDREVRDGRRRPTRSRGERAERAGKSGLEVAPRLGASFEEIEQGAMLQEQLLAAERQRDRKST